MASAAGPDTSPGSASAGPQGSGIVPFFGARQAGIVTPAQDRLAFGAFDLTVDDVGELRELLRAWTTAAARMTAGEPAGPENTEPLAPPDDTGETAGLLASRLTITFGFGPGVFEQDGRDRFGLVAKRPAALRELPRLPAESLDPLRSGGDLCVQACADDPQVAFHALRNLTRIGRGAVVLRWSQLGFGRTSTTSRAQATPRNLMGLKDGTNNVRAEDEGDLERWVWVGDEGPAWLRGGTVMVTRRIRMLLEVWDRASLADQEQTIGRHKASGAPLGADDEFAPVDLAARRDGEPVIPPDAHIRLSAPQPNGGAKLLRRGYSFTDGVDQERGQLDAGLFFVCFQRDPLAQFARIQRSLGPDALNEYIVHTSSAVFAIPPGPRTGGYVGEGLLAPA
ncbi:MAG: iron uptake transporter deferrochelatase/peroxidase subunit [Actinomycetota bacterium]|nr:iron uptake transporter deferrochelatase/peroxidase subunit [Actinomycetota bacterium]